MLMNKLIAEATSNKLGWEYQFLEFFEERFHEYKKYDEFDILYFNKDDFRIRFVNKYNDHVNLLKKTVSVIDRHKRIALLTKAFLDISPFFVDTMKAADHVRKNDKIPRFLMYPNECIAILICEVILTQHRRLLHNDKNYVFNFPENVYIYTDDETKCTYEYELFLLYHQYLSNRSRMKEQFSVTLLSNLYFTLEMSYDIALKSSGDAYYS